MLLLYSIFEGGHLKNDYTETSSALESELICLSVDGVAKVSDTQNIFQTKPVQAQVIYSNLELIVSLAL